MNLQYFTGQVLREVFVSRTQDYQVSGTGWHSLRAASYRSWIPLAGYQANARTDESAQGRRRGKGSYCWRKRLYLHHRDVVGSRSAAGATERRLLERGERLFTAMWTDQEGFGQPISACPPHIRDRRRSTQSCCPGRTAFQYQDCFVCYLARMIAPCRASIWIRTCVVDY